LEINEENIEIRNKLLNLPKIQANENFLNNLQNKIKRIELEEEQAIKQKVRGAGFFGKLFGAKRQPWFVPALGLGVVAVLVFSVILISNKNNIPVVNEKVTTMSQDTPSPQPNQTNSGSTGETLKKDELPGKEITEDFGSNENSMGTLERKYTDQGTNKVRTKTETMKSSDNESEIKMNNALPLIEQKAAEPREETAKNKSTDEMKTEKKVIESERKEGTDKVGRSEYTKKDSAKDEGKNNNDVKEAAKSFQGSTEINKTMLQDLKDKIEKGLKKKD